MATAIRRGRRRCGSCIGVRHRSGGVLAALGRCRPGTQNFELERSTAQAGGHPDVFAKVNFRTKDTEAQESAEDPTKEINACFCTDPKNLHDPLPDRLHRQPARDPEVHPGPARPLQVSARLAGRARHLPSSASSSIYNMEPRPGRAGAARDARSRLLGTPVFTILRARTDSDYGLDATTPDIFHLLGLQRGQLCDLGGADRPVNDKYRSAPELVQQKGCFNSYPEPCFERRSGQRRRRRPICRTRPPAKGRSRPVSTPPTTATKSSTAKRAGRRRPAATCSPSTRALVAKPTTDEADSPSGHRHHRQGPADAEPDGALAVGAEVAQLTLPKGVLDQPECRRRQVRLHRCARARSARLEAATARRARRSGRCAIDSSALPAPIDGAIYLGEPKPGNRYRLIFAADGFETHVKLEGTVELDPESGRVVTRFDESPAEPAAGVRRAHLRRRARAAGDARQVRHLHRRIGIRSLGGGSPAGQLLGRVHDRQRPRRLALPGRSPPARARPWSPGRRTTRPGPTPRSASRSTARTETRT